MVVVGRSRVLFVVVLTDLAAPLDLVALLDPGAAAGFALVELDVLVDL